MLMFHDLFRAFQIEFQQPPQDFFVRHFCLVVVPAIGARDGGIEHAVRIFQPLHFAGLAFVVEIGECAFPDRLGVLGFGDDAVRVPVLAALIPGPSASLQVFPCPGGRRECGDFRHHVHPLGRVQPVFAQFVQALRGGGDFCRVRVGVMLGFEVGGEAFGEGEGFEAGCWGVTGTIFEGCSQPKRPDFMEMRMYDSKKLILITSKTNDCLMRPN